MMTRRLGIAATSMRRLWGSGTAAAVRGGASWQLRHWTKESPIGERDNMVRPELKSTGKVGQRIDFKVGSSKLDNGGLSRDHWSLMMGKFSQSLTITLLNVTGEWTQQTDRKRVV